MKGKAVKANEMTHMGSRYSKRQQIAPYFFCAPYFIIFILFAVFPIFFSAYISLTDWSGISKPVFVGFANFTALLKDTKFYLSLFNTILFMILIIPAQLFIGFILAVLLTHKRIPGKKAFRLMNFLPYLTTPIALGIIFGLLFDSNFGMVNELLKVFHLPTPGWTTQAGPAKALVALLTIWRYAGYTSILFMAGITNINTDLFEACEIDGGSYFTIIRKIIVPLLKPVTIFVTITTMIGCFQIFEEPYMIFAVVAGKVVGGPENAALTGMWYFYDSAFTKFKFGYGSAIGMGLFIVIAVISFTANKLMHRGEENE